MLSIVVIIVIVAFGLSYLFLQLPKVVVIVVSIIGAAYWLGWMKDLRDGKI